MVVVRCARWLLAAALAAPFCWGCGADDGGGDESGVAGAPDAAEAADPSGTWLGVLKAGTTELRVVFNFSRARSGAWVGTLDSPDQGAIDIPLSKLIIRNGLVNFLVHSPPLSFTGEFSADGRTLTGTLSQGGTASRLVLQKQPGPLDYSRPQDPKPPFPYESLDVTFPSEEADVTLAGTLLWPEGDGPFSAVVLVTGSGPQNRDEELVNHRPFLVLADALARAGVAVLRYDDRGFGESTGDFASATSLDLSRDARGAVKFLRTQSHFKAERLGVIGHSEGGTIAPLVAEDNEDVGFIVLLAGTGTDGKTTLISQSRAIGEASGVATDELDIQEQQLESAFACYDPPNDSAESVEACLRDLLDAAGASEEDAAETLAQLNTPWMRFFIPYDPAPVLRRTPVPVLALNGTLDLQVLSGVQLPAIQAALEEGGNDRVSVHELDGLNHLFQHATTGLPAEYGTISETLAPEVLELVTDWVVETTAEGG
jgi:uncharacterized protein